MTKPTAEEHIGACIDDYKNNGCPCIEEYEQDLRTQGRLAAKEEREKIYRYLMDNWSSVCKNYSEHICNGQDGIDISFTKKVIESIKKAKR